MLVLILCKAVVLNLLVATAPLKSKNTFAAYLKSYNIFAHRPQFGKSDLRDVSIILTNNLAA